MHFMKAVILITSVCLGIFEVQIEPESKTIHVDEGDWYYIRFVEDNSTNITHCYYISDTIVGSFEVEKTTNEENTDLIITNLNAQAFSTNVVSHWGNIGWCRFDVNNVDASGPRQWTFTAYDELSRSNITENITVNFYHNIPQLTDRLLIMESSSFIQTLLPEEGTQLTVCTVNFSRTIAQLSMVDMDVTITTTTDEDSNILERLSSLGRNMCGFKLKNSSTDDPNLWTLIGTDNAGEKYRATTTVVLYENLATHTQALVQVGTWYYLSCGLQQPREQYFCYLYDPKGQLVYQDRYCASYKIPIVRLDHLGTWKCNVGISESTASVEFTVELIREDLESVETWSEDHENYTNIGCKLLNSGYSSASLCELVAPDSRRFKLQSGSATERYTTLRTNLSDLSCGIEIEKPLQNFEIGTWKCLIHISPMVTLTGSFITVGNTTNSTYEKHQTKSIELNEPFFIKCNVPYSTDYCHIQAPNGTIYPTDDKYKVYMGECYMAVSRSVASDNGTWICSFARESGVPDDRIEVEITIAEVLIYYDEAEVEAGSDANLICNSGGVPLQYCRFISPNGDAYQLNGFRNTNVVDYNGSGLEYGECGIQIKNVNLTHSGNWTCVTRLGYDFTQPEITVNMVLRVSDNSGLGSAVAASIGVASGLLLVVAVFGGFKTYKYYKGRRHATEDAAVQFSTDTISNGSRESNSHIQIVNSESLIPNYTTSDNN